MKQDNPKSYKLRRGDSSNSWSELPQDLLNSVFERLGFDDSRRVKSVCSSWYSAGRRCVAKKQTPWLILLPDKDNHWCALFNPEEKGGKLYKMRDHDQRVEFAKSFCLDLCSYDLYIFNIFTQERINLPPVESQLGTIKLERRASSYVVYNLRAKSRTFKKDWFCISNDHGLMEKSQYIRMGSPVFWIDEQTKEYVAIWGFSKWCVVYSKKGDEFWNQIQVPILPRASSEMEMLYKDHKLYFLLNDYVAGTNGCIKIFDFSGETPQQTFHCGVPASNGPLLVPPRILSRIRATKLVVTVTGDVLKVEQWGKWVTPTTVLSSFRIYKVYSSGFFNKFEQVDSLGDEAMLFDLGITVLANDDIVGFKRNSIYYNTICHKKYTTQICLFNLETQETEPLHKFDCSSAQQLARTRWFLPTFKQT